MAKTNAGAVDLAKLPTPTQDPRVVALQGKIRNLETEILRLGADLDRARADQEQAKTTAVAALVGDAGRAEADLAGRRLDEAAGREAALRRRIELLGQARETVAEAYRSEFAAAAARARAAWVPHRPGLVDAEAKAEAAWRAARAQLDAFDRALAALPRVAPAASVRVRVLRSVHGGPLNGANVGEVCGVAPKDLPALLAAGVVETDEPWRRVLAGLAASPAAAAGVVACETEGQRA